ncbi:ral guanine nucleotide dissociation stimulator-like isoform X2 [Peromyscus eremicus]|uniref:ral guanine nucleotide dissociation stimulator-like isoform X2 n=1 Tax=Peromyscus eremicus TaxID=42410 RepID=UPI0027DB1622|nr:ral guanine nucleotide dissociation stimulator-like isoform X2 [Peromyscus eremicus]
MVVPGDPGFTPGSNASGHLAGEEQTQPRAARARITQTRYAYFYPDCEEDEEVMGAISTLLDIRIEKFPEDFCQASVLSILKQVKNYLIVNIPHSDVVIRVNELLTQLQAEVASDSEASTEEASEMPASAAHP